MNYAKLKRHLLEQSTQPLVQKPMKDKGNSLQVMLSVSFNEILLGSIASFCLCILSFGMHVSVIVYCACLKVHNGEERRLTRAVDESATALLGAVGLLPGVTSAPLAHLLSSLHQAAATHTFTHKRCRQE